MKNKSNIIYIAILFLSISFFIFSLARFLTRFAGAKKTPVEKKIVYADSNIVFSDATHDFGEVFEGDIVYREFDFVNAGTETLEITKVKSSCGCTAADYPKKVRPGAKGKIKIKYNTTSRNGKSWASVYAHTNSKDNPVATITVYATVNPTLIIDPPVTLFMNIEVSGDQEKTLSLQSAPGSRYDFDIKKINCSVDFAGFKYKRKGKNNFDIIISLDSQKAVAYYNKRVEDVRSKNPRYKPPEHKKVGGTLNIVLKSKDNKKFTYYFYASLNQ